MFDFEACLLHGYYCIVVLVVCNRVVSVIVIKYTYEHYECILRLNRCAYFMWMCACK